MCQLHTHTQLTRKSRSNESMNDSSTNKVKLKHRKNKKKIFIKQHQEILHSIRMNHILLLRNDEFLCSKLNENPIPVSMTKKNIQVLFSVQTLNTFLIKFSPHGY